MRLLKKKWGFLFLALTLFCCSGPELGAESTLCEPSERTQGNDKSLKYCITSDWLPYEKIGSDGVAIGMGPDIARLLEKKTGIKFDPVKSQTWPESLSFLKSGCCDLIIFMDMRTEPVEEFLYTRPLLTSPTVIVGRKEKGYVNGIAGLKGNKVVVVEDGHLASWLKKELPEIDCLLVDTAPDAFRAVTKGQADVSLVVLTSFVSTAQNNDIIDLRTVGEIDFKHESAIGVRRNNPELRDFLDQVLNDMESFKVDAVINQWTAFQVEKKMDYRWVWISIVVSALVIAILVHRHRVLAAYNRRIEASRTALKEEKKIAENALKAEREVIRQNLNFIDMISHEYRIPISILVSNLDLLEKKMEVRSLPDITGQVERMRKATRRLTDLFKTSLNKKRIRSAEVSFNKEKIELTSVIGAVVGYSTNAFPGYHIQFDRKNSNKVIVEADPDLLNIALTNILDNACKYSDDQSPVIVKSGKAKNHAFISIRDHGIGIAPKELEHVFEKYYRSANAGKAKGAGVGLFLVKKIIRLHQGDISISSTPGKGTTFTIELPLIS